ncbi:hypothetical protein HK102_014090 [Quaeritorhiza haematococci]|nr:hypothetical protein HK102_014090 [Quaeritorhiza haematococci]
MDKFEAEVNAFQALQKDLSKAVATRAQLEAQLKENEMVQQEFKHLKDDSAIYKLIGPVLVKQDRAESETNVKKRIEFISGEMKRVDAQIKELEEKQEKKRIEVMKLQTQLQEQMQKTQ